MPKADAVFEGGGVKGIGLVGAVARIEEAGYTFENLAGTSAGAIVAALLGVGYTGLELKAILQGLDYNDFKDEGLLDKIPGLGKALSVGFEYGIYEGEFFETWFEDLLQRKGKTKFRDIRTEYPEAKYRYKAQVIAADITDRNLLVLPGDLDVKFGLDPDEFSIARAVRMSMSIPLFFEPVRLQDRSGRTHFIVDGGVLSNYPIWLLDDGTSDPEWPTFGFKLMEPDQRELKGPARNPINNPLAFLKAVVGTMMDAHDSYHISRSAGDLDRTIGIPTRIKVNGLQSEVRTTDFDLTRDESDALFDNGVGCADIFLSKWNFADWKKKYRNPVKAGAAAASGDPK